MHTKYLAVFLALPFLLSVSTLAAPPNAATLDGKAIEYDTVDLRGTNTEAPQWGGNVISNLYVTWDTNALYVMLQGWNGLDDNKLAVLVDVDPGNGTGATTTTNWTGQAAGYIGYNGVGWVDQGGVFGLDYMISTEGNFNNIVRAEYDGAVIDTNSITAVFDTGNGSEPQGGAVDMVTAEDSCPLRGFEARIPWSELYNSNRFGTVSAGQIVPPGASLRLFANLHNNDNQLTLSTSNTIPVSARASFDGAVVTTSSDTNDFINVVVDGNADGIPDVAATDVNAPYIGNATGADGNSTLFILFSEDTTPATAGATGNYIVNGLNPSAVTILSSNLVELTLASPLPPEGTQVLLQTTGIQDPSANARATSYCLIVGTEGISSPVTVTFVLNTNSGFRLSAEGLSTTAFFLNSGTLPLQQGFPPATANPLAAAGGDYFTNSVTFPAGTSGDLGYRYSGILSNGTNNYEAIRLDNYAFEERRITLNDLGTPMVVTDYLGAAASPLRQGDTGYDTLYADPYRGDAGVRERVTFLFQLDLSQRFLGDVDRVLLLGMDPLRGFNANAAGQADYPSESLVGWDIGGIAMTDDGPAGGNGDLLADDGIYSVLWSATPDGSDSAIVPDSPYSLVGGGEFDDPYLGDDEWERRRSPRSFAFKYAVVVDDGDLDPDNDGLLSPGSNIDYYYHDADGTSVTNPPFVWDNDALPKLSVAWPATILDVFLDGSSAKVVFTNITKATDNTIEIASEPGETWSNFGLAGFGADNTYTATVEGATNDTEVFRIRTPGYARSATTWSPHPATTGDTVTVLFNQNGQNLAGETVIGWAGSLNSWDGAASPMTFLSNGLWTVSIDIPTNQTGGVYFKLNNDPDLDGGWSGSTTANDGNSQDSKDFAIVLTGQGVSWTPNKPLPGGTLDVTYDPTGKALTNKTIHIHYGFNNSDFTSWSGGSAGPGVPMTSNAPNEWVYTINLPATATSAVNFVFNDGTVTWDTEDNNDGKDYNVFVGP